MELKIYTLKLKFAFMAFIITYMACIYALFIFHYSLIR